MRVETIGDATLYLGDCLEILPTLGKVDAVVTDPPYGISYKGSSVDGKATRFQHPVIYGDDKPFDPRPFLFAETTVLWGANHYADKLPASAAWFVWDKRDGMTSNANSDVELAWSSVGGSARLFVHRWNGMIKATEKDQQRVHPTQKPVALMAWVIGVIGSPVIILDPFMGSGTTGVACAQLGRKFIGIEVDHGYFDIACRRIEQAQAQGKLPLATGFEGDYEQVTMFDSMQATA